MFDIGFPELLVVAVITLLVIGPERMPEALRTLGLWLGRMRRSFTQMKAEIEREVGMDEVRRQLHNEAVLDEMKRIERDMHGSIQPPEPGESARPAESFEAQDDPARPAAPPAAPQGEDERRHG